MTPAKVRDELLVRIHRHHKPTKTFDVVSSLIAEVSNIHISEAQEIAETILPKVIAYLSGHIEKCNRERRSCTISLSSSGGEYISGVDHIKSDDAPEVSEVKRRRLIQSDLQKKILKLSSVEFENLMERVLSGLGVQEVTITSTSSDDGIDFFGRIKLGDFYQSKILPDHFLNEVEMVIVGQAKRYRTSKFKLADVRELVGTVQLLRSKVSAKVSEKVGVEAKVADPVLNLFVISNKVSSNGWRLAQRAGVKILDLEKLSLLLADLEIQL